MKHYRKELWFDIPTRRALINITPDVDACLQESGIQNGLLLCNAMHITASVFINDDEAGLHHDYEVWLEKLAPHAPVSQYRHNTYEDNADAHMKRQIMGRRWSWPLPTENWILVPGSRFFTVSLMVNEKSGFLLKLLENNFSKSEIMGTQNRVIHHQMVWGWIGMNGINAIWRHR